MKKIVLAVLITVLLTLAFSSAVLAGGDKVRGDSGLGAVNQIQIQDPPPFQ